MNAVLINKKINHLLRYFVLKIQTMIQHKIIQHKIIPNSSDSGAGIAPIENYLNHQKSRRESAIILFHDVQTGMYTVAGGMRNQNEDIEDTARREGKEESANLFRFPKTIMNGSFAVRHRNFVVYFVGLQSPIMSKYYDDNVKTLKNNGAPHDYLETDKMVRVYISDLEQAGVRTVAGNILCNDANGNQIKIEGRTKAVIREALNAGFIPSLPINIPRVNGNFNDSNQPHLRGTKCYFL